MNNPAQHTVLPTQTHDLAPFVSIALCTYNGARFLREQLDSLLAQTHRNFEIIAVDDCSTDDSVHILQEYAGLDSRLKVHVNSVNLGFNENFAIAMHHCGGVFVAPCDQDDIWHPQKISVLLQTIGARGLAYCDSELVNESGQSLEKNISHYVKMLTTQDPATFLFVGCTSGHAMLFTRDLVPHAMPFPREFYYDWWLAVVATTRGGVIFHNEVLVKYRQHSNSVTSILNPYEAAYADKSPGYKLAALRRMGRKITLLTELSGPQQPNLLRLKWLWDRRETQWLSLSLAWYMIRHGLRLHATQKDASRWFVLRRALKYIWGVKAKRLFNQRAYQASERTHLKP